jgi:hypothetical protein
MSLIHLLTPYNNPSNVTKNYPIHGWWRLNIFQGAILTNLTTNKFYNHNKNKTIPIATLHYKQSVRFSCNLRFIIREENRSKEGDTKTKSTHKINKRKPK